MTSLSIWGDTMNQYEATLNVLSEEGVLPTDPKMAISGSALYKKILPRLTELSDGIPVEGTVRQYFSYMTRNQIGSIAKRAGKNGYYARKDQTDENEIEGVDVNQELQDRSSFDFEKPVGRNTQSEEKFRSIFTRLSDMNYAVFSRSIEHTKATKGTKGKNRWKFPDVVTLHWDTTVVDPESNRLYPEVFSVRQASGDHVFVIESTELKVNVSVPSLREYFFQCVSNSKWANRTTLAIACAIDDESVEDEIRRLGMSYGVHVKTYGLTEESFLEIPNADTIIEMDPAEFETLVDDLGIDVKTVSPIVDRASLDWPHIADMRTTHSDFKRILEWISSSIADKRVRSFEIWEQVEVNKSL